MYVVADRSTGRGIVLDQNMPESVKRTRYGRTPGGVQASKPALRSVAGDPTPSQDPPATGPATGDKADEVQVQKRRAAFKVIDGGS